METDYNTDYENNFPLETDTHDFDVREDYDTNRIEESYDETDSYNFYPDAAF
jgi:hypothetical protein